MAEMRDQIIYELRQELVNTQGVKITFQKASPAAQFKQDLEDSQIQVIPGIIPRVQQAHHD